MAINPRRKRTPDGGVVNTGDSIAGERMTKMDTQFPRKDTGEPISGNLNMNVDRAMPGEFIDDESMPSMDMSELAASGNRSGGASTPTGDTTMKQGYASESQTGAANQDYDLVSVLYHSLQGAETCAKYIKDAEQTGDNDLADFFREVMEHGRQTAQRAMHLLAERTSRGTGFGVSGKGAGEQPAHH